MGVRCAAQVGRSHVSVTRVRRSRLVDCHLELGAHPVMPVGRRPDSDQMRRRRAAVGLRAARSSLPGLAARPPFEHDGGASEP